MSYALGRPAGAHRPGHPAVLLLVTCVVAGVLVAAAAFPLVGGVGLLARSGAESFAALPAALVEPPLPQASRILARDGSTLAVVYFNENRVVVPLARVPRVVRDAILAVEDARFYDHGGVDVRGVVRAALRNRAAGEIEEGASTITQQYVKNVLVASARDDAQRKAAVERSTLRKVREARYALEIERRYSKDEIFEKYLNIVYFGDGVYGVGTAAQHYFGRPVAELGAAEAALLAGLIQNPGRYDPVEHPERATARRDVVLDRMEALGLLGERAAERARRKPLRLRIVDPPGLEDNPLAPYFLDHLRSEVLDDPAGTMAPIFGETPAERAQTLFQGGLTIRTTLDPAAQRTARDALRRTLPGPTDPAGVAVVVQPGTGDIRVMAGVNHERRTRKVNLATGGTTGFQAGSTFKVFVLAAAIEQGIPLGTRIYSPQTYRSRLFRNYVDGRIGPYTVRNAGDSEAGSFDVMTGTWHSVNTFYVQLEERTGFVRPAEIAEAMGVGAFPLARVPSFVLGTNEVSPLDMATAYAAFAAHGLRCAPRAILSVARPDGRVASGPAPRCQQAIERRVADTVTAVLRGVLDRGTGRAATLDRPAAGKTGTTNGPTAAWFDGYTPDFAGVVWVGHPTDPARRPLLGVQGVRVVYGGTLPARVWREVMLAVHAGVPVRDFELADVAPYRPVVPRAPRSPAPPGASPAPSAAPEPEPRPTERCKRRPRC